MSANNCKSSQEFGRESTADTARAIDFDFLVSQTFADAALERDVLELFVVQARRLLASLPALDPARQADTAHLLKGSARGIGAWTVAESAQRYEAAAPGDRPLLMPHLCAAVVAAERAIGARLGACDERPRTAV